MLELRSHVKTTCNFKEIVNFEINTLKSIFLTRIFHIRALALPNVLAPCETLKDPYFWCYDYEYKNS